MPRRIPWGSDAARGRVRPRHDPDRHAARHRRGVGRAVGRDRRADRQRRRRQPARAAARRGAGAVVPGRARRRDGRPVPRALPRAGRRADAGASPAPARPSTRCTRHGGRVVVVTGKYGPNARLHLDHLGLDVDELVGWLWGPAQGRGAARARRHGLRRRPPRRHRGRPGGGRRSASRCRHRSDQRRRAARGGRRRRARRPRRLPGVARRARAGPALADLDARLTALGSVLVAFSGGADSAFLLAAAARALGPENVVAATAVLRQPAERRAGGGARLRARRSACGT